ncbi:amino acid adenylation domain-containing protein [Streptomyces parvulus]|uniref:amino acid adenylation domain-containing protein n=1 Tax=Streptomyces parvulus TaxID=146923 RepID=UPI003421B384
MMRTTDGSEAFEGLAARVHLHALRDPDALAVVDGPVELTYAALDSAGQHVAEALARAGIRPAQPVAVALPRSWRLVCVMLGVLRLGATVVPLDRNGPEERGRYILDDSGAVAVVCDPGVPPKGTAVPVIAADALLPERPAEDVPPARELSRPAPGDPVFAVIYTSGTTGRPKGVEVPAVGVQRMAAEGWLGLPEGARFSCLSNPAFDALTFEVWVPLLTGGCCVVLPDDDVQAPERFAEVLRRQRIDTALVTVALFNTVVDTAPECFNALGQLLIGGEQLNARTVRRWYRHNPGSTTRLYNAYGPTEVSTVALSHPIPRAFDGDVVPIGRPLPRTGAAIVVPGTERAAVPGEVGELFLSGAGLAAGYRNRPEETARRFVHLPWLDDGRSLHYRTGDLVHADADGIVTYVGRADRQVKVRGFRIEPGEVERQITAHAEVLQAHVCTRRTGPSDVNELIAFVVTGDSLTFEEFDAHLTARLPAYMRPHHVYRVPALPVTANGKVDQAALLNGAGRPWRTQREDRPVTPLERDVLALAEEILGTEVAGPADRWIACGGDSLKALRMRFAIRTRWGCDLPQSTVLHGDIAGIARQIAEAGVEESEEPHLEASGARTAPATSEQQRLWLQQQRSPGSRAYHVGQGFRLDGPVDPETLRRALSAVVARHPALRTAFEATAEGLLQHVGESYDPLTVEDSEAPWDTRRARTAAEEFFAEPFDLGEPRMLRARWLPGPDGGFLLLQLHHIAVDGWSLGLLLKDLSAAYAAILEGADPPGPSSAPTPLDFAGWQAARRDEPGYRADRDALITHYGSVEEPAEPMALAGAPALGRARLLHTALDTVRRAHVDRLCTELGLTRFQVLLGLFTGVLYGVTGVTRPRMAAPVANRPVRDLEDSVGMFANTVLLPLNTAPGDGLRAHIAAVGAASRAVLDRQDVVLADVLSTPETASAGFDADGSGSPFDVLFVLENTDFDALSLPDCTARPVWWPAAEAKCALTVSVIDGPDGLDWLWEYADGHFDPSAVAAMADMLRQALDLLAGDRAVTSASLAAPYRRSLPSRGTGAERPLAWRTVAEGFARQAARTPHAPAVVSGGLTLDYAGLDARAALLAADLLDHYAIPAGDTPCHVALYMEPSVEHVVALLALARLNVTAVPLDPSYPSATLRRVLERVEPLCVLVAGNDASALDDFAPAGLVRHPVAAPAPAIAANQSPPPPRAHDGARPLYTLFTSGSTGTPKGVQVPERTLAGLLQWQSDTGGLGAPAATQQFSMLSFDVSFQEVFGTLCAGGALHLVRPEWRTDVPAFLDQLERSGAERVFMPYVALQLLAEHAVHLGRFPTRLRDVVTAGEQLVCTEAIRRFFAGLRGARLHNHYGPTETHVVSALTLDGDPYTWPDRPAIGRPVDGVVLRVVDTAGELLPPGRTGNLLIGGTATTRCYLDDPVLNEERFTEIPGAGLFYRSGDRARFDEHGLLHYAGRDDQQVKLSGRRLELGGVEAALLQHPRVVNAVVVRDGDRLTACVQCRGETPTADELASHLASLLPAWVKIDRFRQVSVLPRTASGKLDRAKALRVPGTEIGRTAAAESPLTPEEAQLAEAFHDATGLPIGPEQTFFEAGASSLDLMRFHLHCTSRLAFQFTVADLFEHVTVRSLARRVRAGGTTADDAHVTAPGARQHPAPPLPGTTEEPVAIVGMAVRLPGAPDLRAFWDLVTSGGTGIQRFDAPEGVIGARSELDGLLAFDAGHFGISPHDARLMDPHQRHLLMACVQAMAHAGLGDRTEQRTGLIASAGENTYFQAMLREADPAWLPDGWQLAQHHDKDFLATKAAYHLGLTGPAFTVQSACSSSLVAVHVAAGMLRQGDAEVMLAGGVLADPTLTDGYRYRPQHIFSADGDCRPFSDDASGTVGASGVGVVVLKPLAAARRDGDTVYAVITGSAVNNDGSDKLGYSAPSRSGQRDAIRSALARAGRTGEDIGYVEAHGTGTRLGDPVEVDALRQAFASDTRGHCALSSVKSQLGHLGAAAGVVGLVRAALAVHHGVIPPNLGFRAFNPDIGPHPDPFYVPTEACPWPEGRERVAALSSFGIGGTNAHLILEAAPARAGQSDLPEADGPSPLPRASRCLVLSAGSEQALRLEANRVADYLEAHPDSFDQILRHLQSGRRALGVRAAAPCPDPSAAVRWLRSSDLTRGPQLADLETHPEDASRANPAADWASGRDVAWPPGPAQAPWDFPPPAFALTEYDFPRGPQNAPPPVPADAFPDRLPDSQWLHQPHWVRHSRAWTVTSTASPRVAVLLSEEPLPTGTTQTFAATHARVVQVVAGDGFTRLGPDLFHADPTDSGELRRVLDTLDDDNGEPLDVDWLHALPLALEGAVTEESVDRARWSCLDTAAAALRALSGRPGPRPRVWWLSYRARPVHGRVERPEAGLLAGPLTVGPQECAVDSHWLDLPSSRPDDWAAPLAALIARATREADDLPAELALRRGHWWRQTTSRVTAGTDSPAPIPSNGVYLVLGGTGGIGRSVATWLLENTDGRVVVMTRRAELPQGLASWGDRVGLVTADLASTSIADLTEAVEKVTGRLDGIVHAAGGPSGALIAQRDAPAMAAASAAARKGALLVERLITRHRPAIAVHCSSMSAHHGGLGQFDYAASAGLLNAFAHLGEDGADTERVTIDWDVWSEVGMAVGTLETDRRHQAHLSVGLSVDDGLRVLHRALAVGLPHILVSTTGLDESHVYYAPPTVLEAAEQVGRASVTPAVEDPSALLDRWLRDLLGFEAIDADAPLYELGADSLTMLDLIGKVEGHFQVQLDLSHFSHRVNLTEILGHLRDALPEEAEPPSSVVEAEVTVDVWQHGSGPHVLCLIHPVGGDIQSYRPLVSALGPEPTVCLIADPALRTRRPLDWSLTERARRYDAAIRERLDGRTRRLRLVGWSFGARVAMEMARLSEDAGHPVAGLHLLDPPPPLGGVPEALDEKQLETVFARELGLNADTPTPTTDGARHYAERLARCCRSNLESLAAHRPHPLTGTPVHLWLATRPAEGLPVQDPRDLARLWANNLPATSEQHLLDTDHYGIVQEPHASAVAHVITGSLSPSPPDDPS